MTPEEKKLYMEFNKIRKLGWIESMRNGTGGIGYTFETLLGKEEDYLQAPDYLGIEIKTMRQYGKKKIHLFCLAPDGDCIFPIDKIVEVLGYPDKEYKNYKVLSVNLTTLNYSSIGNNRAKIFVNWKDSKVEIIACNMYCKSLGVNVSWSFELIKKAIYNKLQNLAIVKAYYKNENEKDYYYYNHISFYRLKDFNTFVKLIEKGYIEISFNVRIYKDIENLGKMNDRGTNFTIMEENIELLYDKVDF